MAKTIKKKNMSVRYYTKPKDYIYMVLVHILCAVSVICILIPLIYVVAASFSSPKALLSGRVFLVFPLLFISVVLSISSIHMRRQ